MNGFDEVIFKHIFREQNRLADSLAKKALDLHTGFLMLDEVPIELRDLLFEDRLGVQYQRCIPHSRRSQVL